MHNSRDSQEREADLQAFTAALLEDVRALEVMIERGLIETGVRRIGAEQEIFLVDGEMRPAPVADDVLAKVQDHRLTNELARYNLEANLSPQYLAGDGLRRMERELRELLGLADDGAKQCDARVLLTGILPTLEKGDLGHQNMTPKDRYRELDRVTRAMRGGDFHVMIKGLDELEMTHDNVMLESCTTSFQLHLQVGPEEFANLYNVAQVATAPVLAAAVNSAVLLQHRLWAETRIALFQRALDARSRTRHHRRETSRAQFGSDWVDDSVLELLREDIARYRIMLTRDLDPSPMGLLESGEIPALRALCLHNGTIWRWNRPCYGVNDGVAHLRIENRALPAGPTVIDAMANAAFFYGLMTEMPVEYEHVARTMSFDDARQNFFGAARHGLDAQLAWPGEGRRPARDLILDRLVPLAAAGLRRAGVDAADATRYLDVLRDRVERNQTGASWVVSSLQSMNGAGTTDRRSRALVRGMLAGQHADRPVGEWEPAAIDPEGPCHGESIRTVGQIMSTDLFTVRPADIIDLAASVMDWRHIRHVPVEDDDGRLVGILSYRDLMKLMARRGTTVEEEPITVASLMRTDPVSVAVDTTTLEAVETMKRHAVACLPVLDDGKLAGILTDHDLMNATRWIIVDYLSRDSGNG